MLGNRIRSLVLCDIVLIHSLCHIIAMTTPKLQTARASSTNLGFQDIGHENHIKHCWYCWRCSNINIRKCELEPSSILESRCSALSSQCQVPECLRFQMFLTWQISRTRVKHGKSIVNPQIHASCDFASKLVGLGALSEKLCSWQEKLVSTQWTVQSNGIHQKTVDEKVPQDLWWPKPCEAIDIVLKSLEILGFMPQPHYNITKHNTKVQTCTNYWRTKQRVIEKHHWDTGILTVCATNYLGFSRDSNKNQAQFRVGPRWTLPYLRSALLVLDLSLANPENLW